MVKEYSILRYLNQDECYNVTQWNCEEYCNLTYPWGILKHNITFK
jgi:hypothetical protein